MKTQALALAVAMAGWLMTVPAFADHDEHHEAQGGAKAAAADPCRPDGASVDRMLDSLPGQIEAIRNTEDPQERQRLLRDHLVTMEGILNLMERSQGSKRMGHGMMGDDDEQPMRRGMMDEDDDDQGTGRGMMEDEDRGRRMRRGMMEDDGGRRMGRGMMGGGMGMMAMHRSVEQRLDRLQKLLQQLIEHELAEKGGNE